MKTEEQKQKIALIAVISTGIVAILCGVATFCGIYFTTKDYRLVKDDYDVYLNKDKLTSEELNYVYRNNESQYFTKIDFGYRIELDALINNNPSFKSNDYKIHFQYQATITSAGPQGNTDYPSLLLTSKDNSIKKELGYSNTSMTTVDNLYFNDDTDYIDLKFVYNKDTKWELDIDQINLQFFSLKK